MGSLIKHARLWMGLGGFLLIVGLLAIGCNAVSETERAEDRKKRADSEQVASEAIAPSIVLRDSMMSQSNMYYHGAPMATPRPEMNTEEYSRIDENNFKDVIEHPLSTFSIDVDTASYANCRRFITDGQMPPKDAVRIEEFINYFNYDYAEPKGEAPLGVNCELTKCPWNPENELLMLGLQAVKIDLEDAPANNLVFLLDVSGSMNSADKLGLLKKGMRMLVDRLRPQDRVAIVVYAGSAGLVLESTPGDEKAKIIEAIDRLSAGGSTAGGAGIQLAYKVAEENFDKEGNNRVILGTDGDFNVGVSDTGALTRLIEEKRESGVFLSVLGFGRGNLKDSRMEQIADKGNGNYAYIDSAMEAKKALVSEFGGTMIAVAKDVKLQIEFNPAFVKSYRLVGYENRVMASEDFDNDKKDAGELGAGHQVTALYELVPAEAKVSGKAENGLNYQDTEIVPSEDLMTLKFRYKAPDGDTSKKVVEHVKKSDIETDSPSANFEFATSVAEFGMILRDSEHKGRASIESLIARAKKAKGEDAEGYRAQFISLAEMVESMQN